MQTDEYAALVFKYAPGRDASGWVSEDAAEYARRMQETLLPNWPEEPLKEWLHRHAGFIHHADLGFEKFIFSPETWDLADIPGCEAFSDETRLRASSTLPHRYDQIEIHAAARARDWLACYMLAEGTWNTPIILLDNRGGQAVSKDEFWPVRSPYHLLEGHRRLLFLQDLKRLHKARPRHSIWVVHLGA